MPNNIPQPHASIIIRAYNEEKHIGRLLTGIMQQRMDDLEIILVDSGSTDSTIEIASKFPVKVIQIHPEEFTFGRSLNLGISHARGEYIVMASAHVYPVFPDWLERLVEPFSDKQVGLTYGKQRGNSTSKFSEHQIFARWYPDQSYLKKMDPFCNNANAAIRRTLWEQHAYDETLTGLEDLEWARWAMEQGYVLSYIAEAEVVHVHDEKPRDVYNRYRREAIAFKRLFPDERFSVWDFTRLVISNLVSDFWHAIREGVFTRHAGSILWFRWMQFWGTYQGFRHSGPLTWQLRQTFYYPHELRARADDIRQDIQPIQYEEDESEGE